MRRHILALGASALCLALAPTLALGAQGNDADADTNAVNANTSGQLIAQSGGGTADQSATNIQLLPVAVAPAVAPQVLPVNLNVPISVASEGDPADVEQSNEAEAEAAASNQNASSQEIVQRGGDSKKGSDGGSSASQSATNVQVAPVAVAPAVAPQIAPINANVPISIASEGDPAEVDQSNTADADAEAANVNGSSQAILQGGGGGSATQSATNLQVLPVALAPAIAPQVLPVNVNAPITVGNPLRVLSALPVDPFALLANPLDLLPLDAVTGLLPTVTGLLPLDAVTGLLPLGAVTGLLPIGLPALGV